ncbi:DUF58 domain-containing protein [Pseudomonadota bacterium]|nr:DUF58 domain-containing protein [Pseudomonadota bacterium]
MTHTLRQIYQRFNQLRGRRIFITPTRFGFVYVGFLILILVGAVNYSNSMGHLLCFLLASMGIIAMLHTYRNLAKIHFKHAHAEPVFCGQIIDFTLVFDNPTHQNSYQIEIASKQKKSPSWNPFKHLAGYNYNQIISTLNKQQLTHITHSFTSQHRGKQALGHIRVASLFPVGLFNTWTYFDSLCTTLVYPTPSGSLPLPNAIEYGQQFKLSQQNGVDDFSGFNNYRSGDPIHAIAWKAMARDDILRTKRFSSPQGGHLMLSWQDVTQINDIEGRLSQLCLWVLQAEAAGMTYALTLPHIKLSHGSGIQHHHRCLTALALYE